MSKDLRISSEEYQKTNKQKQPKPPLAKNIIYAFLFGGLVSVFGQLVLNFYIALGFSAEEAGNPMVATIIFIAAVLTGLDLFDDIARVAGAGVAIHVTGFANSLASSALEFKREGLIAGVGSKMFILAGSVIVFGVVTAFVVGIISALV